MQVDVLICNLTRFGDLLQSQPLISALKASGRRTGLLCLENFAPAGALLRDLDACWMLPGSSFMAEMDQSWPRALGHFARFESRLLQEAGSPLILNLTPTLPARLLTRILAQKISVASGRPTEALGFGLSPEGFGENHGLWASFLSVATLRRGNTPFNIADIFRRCADSILPEGILSQHGHNHLLKPSPAELNWASAFITSNLERWQEKGAKDNTGFVAFQLGASAAPRQWPVEYFAAVGDMLWREQKILPIILGSAAEGPLARAYAEHARHSFINAVGKTSLPQLAALLWQTKLLLTNDTGTMHLAAGLGIPCAAFFLATAQPWDTGPYLEGCCALEPRLDCHPCAFGSKCSRLDSKGEALCRKAIQPGPVGRLLLGYLENHNWRTGFGAELPTQARAWESHFDQHGFMDLEPLINADMGRKLWMEELRRFWRQLLDSLESSSAQYLPAPEALSAQSPSELRKLALDNSPILEQGASIMALLAETGDAATLNARAGQLFLRNCERLQILLDSSAELCALAAFWRELRESRGGDMKELLPALRQLSEHLRRFAQSLSSFA